jgi:hypothetical protein
VLRLAALLQSLKSFCEDGCKQAGLTQVLDRSTWRDMAILICRMHSSIPRLLEVPEKRVNFSIDKPFLGQPSNDTAQIRSRW